jgi:hypothetical protein
MTPPEIMNGLKAKNRLLTAKNDEYIELAEKKAQAERDYNVAVRTKTMELRSADEKITLIPTLVKGDSTVAKLKFDLDVATAVERACLESIKDIRSQIDTYRSLLSWLKAELQSQ